MDILKVILAKQAKRDLLKVPSHIVRKFMAWVDDVEHIELNEVRKNLVITMGPLKRKQNRPKVDPIKQVLSGNLHNKQEGKIEVVEVLEVNKHDY